MKLHRRRPNHLWLDPASGYLRSWRGAPEYDLGTTGEDAKAEISGRAARHGRWSGEEHQPLAWPNRSA